MGTAAICAVLLAIVILGILNYRKKLASGCCGSGGEAAPKKINAQDRSPGHYPYAKILSIDGMTCRNCAIHVQNALNSLDGVLAKVDLSEKKAVVHMKEELPAQLLSNAVAEAGYTVVSIGFPQNRFVIENGGRKPV